MLAALIGNSEISTKSQPEILSYHNIFTSPTHLVYAPTPWSSNTRNTTKSKPHHSSSVSSGPPEGHSSRREGELQNRPSSDSSSSGPLRRPSFERGVTTTKKVFKLQQRSFRVLLLPRTLLIVQQPSVRGRHPIKKG